jgi:lipopolysaccharide export system protein LptC
MNWLERIAIFSIVIVLGGITAWMQTDLLAESENLEQVITENHDPDYYIENFTAVGMDTEGNRQYAHGAFS